MKSVEKYFWGLLACVVVAFAAYELNSFLKTYELAALGSVTLAIIVGLVAGNLLHSQQKRLSGGVSFAEKKLLPFAIALLGIGVSFKEISELSGSGSLVVLLTICTSVVSALLLYRVFKIKREFALLIATGNAICGSSAIAAMSPVLKSEDDEIGLSISAVNLCGVVGIMLLPFLCWAVGFNETASGMSVGGTLQAVGQVSAAGYSMGDIQGQVSVITKMARVLMLGPAVVFFALFLAPKATGEEASDSKAKKWYQHVPLFIVAFFVLAAVNSFGLLPENIVSELKHLDKLVLLVAMAGIGMRIHLRALLGQGPKALLFCLTVWFFQIAVVLGVLYLL